MNSICLVKEMPNLSTLSDRESDGGDGPMVELTFNVKSSHFCGFQVIFKYIKFKVVFNFSYNV